MKCASIISGPVAPDYYKPKGYGHHTPMYWFLRPYVEAEMEPPHNCGPINIECPHCKALFMHGEVCRKEWCCFQHHWNHGGHDCLWCFYPPIKGPHCDHCHACASWAANGRPAGAGYGWRLPFAEGTWVCGGAGDCDKVLCCDYCQKSETEDNKLRKCSRCQAVRYCDEQCQRGDWPQHGKICKKK